MDTDGPVPLTYVPVRFCRRRSVAARMTVAWAALVPPAAAGCVYVHLGDPLLVFLGIVTALVAAVVPVAAWKGWADEVRVEGDMLAMRSPATPAVAVPVDDVRRITLVRGPGDGPPWYEVAVRGRGRLRVPAGMFDPIGPVRAAVWAVNPAVRFDERPGTERGACGESVVPTIRLPGGITVSESSPRDRCVSCGGPVPQVGQFV